LAASEEYQKYLDSLKEGLNNAYGVASEARKKGFDPSDDVEIKIAKDVASRVEALVGPPGIAKIIRDLEAGGMVREEIAFNLAAKIAGGEICKGTTEQLIEQAVRTSVSVLTEGVLVAPTEGISRVKISSNPDGSSFVAVYFTGPIRSAGGTVAALAVALADYARRAAKIGDFRATDSEIERYAEEVNIYESRSAHLQYKPPDEDVKWIVKNCPVCIHGEPTEDFEVSVHRDLPRMESNRIRGGVPLVICEGIAQKAAKVYSYAKKFGLGWDWLEKLIKIKRRETIVEVKPDWTYLEGLVAGRPVFAYPSTKGGFRIRYGKSRNNSIMAKNIHPATMVLLDDFVAVGTHVKIERPGKGAILSGCDAIEPPLVKMKDGSVLKVNSAEQARKLKPDVEKVLFLGDMLVTYGDFLKSGHPLIPSGWCEEWWAEECRAVNVQPKEIKDAADSFEFSRANGIPLHPKLVYFWHDVDSEQIKELAEWLVQGSLRFEEEVLREFSLKNSKEKEILELLGVEHRVADERVFLSGDDGYALLSTLGLLDGETLSLGTFMSKYNDGMKGLQLVNLTAEIQIKAKAPVYVGARMGRPEKARERAMDGNVNVLFPSGSPKNRSLMKAYKGARENAGGTVYLDLARFICPNCHTVAPYRKCELCGTMTVRQMVCQECKRYTMEKEHCGKPTSSHEQRAVKINDLINALRKKCGAMPEDIKGVKGLSSSEKIPERLEKGVYRARHGVYVFRDGTSRFDATDVPLTHFKPNEIGTSVEKLKEMGYKEDYLGNELKNKDQILLLKPQDIVVSDHGADYFINVAKFIDDLLVGLYSMQPYYNAKNRDALIGHLFLGLSPHTSSGVLVRLIGFNEANVGFGHPFFHAAKRRNCDGDEDAVMLLMDALLNFSRHYLSDTRGGTMDAPITLSTVIDPQEIDDEAHNVELVSYYPLEFYRAAEKFSPANSVKIKIVKNVLGKPEQYEQMGLTHMNSNISDGPLKTAYLSLDSIPEKVRLQFNLEKRLLAVDVKDVAERLILSHFIPDLYGNLRAFSRQTFRCTDCNYGYRRPPLSGKCIKCRGNLLLNINKGGIEKYLKISLAMVDEYGLPAYLKQRILLIEKEIASIFEDEKVKQTGLADFM
ncbi:DNA polymerase II large subunit, partial [Candidatus Micrarchaeota archaeon]|nr:DNA polymerase II large subunit [Candidatus Micrarchaeota archaeon]